MAAFFSGYFSKGERGVPTLLQTTEELMSVFGPSTSNNYNDWHQAYNYLSYANNLWVTRVVGDDSMNAYDGYPNIESPTLIWDEEDFITKFPTISIQPGNSLKAIAVTPGTWGNGIEIAAITLKEWNQNVVVYNNIKAKEVIRSMQDEDYALFVIKDNRIQETFVEPFDNLEIINTLSKYIYIKTDVNNPQRYIDGNVDIFDGNDFVYDGNEEYYYGVPVFYGEKIMKLEGGYNTSPSLVSVEDAYDDILKEEYVINYVIANETSPESAIRLAETRKDCIAFIGVPNIPKSDIIAFRDTLGHSEYSTLIAQYKFQYDEAQSKEVWVNIAGDIAGIKAMSDFENEEYTAAAGLQRGIIQNAIKMKFELTTTESNRLYRNAVNTIGKVNNYFLNEQKLLVDRATLYDRVHIRALFNKLERDINVFSRYTIFDINDNYLRNKLVTSIKPYLAYIRSDRGIQDFHVICDKTNNTDVSKVVLDIIIKPTNVSEFIRLRFNIEKGYVDIEYKTRSI